MLLQRGKACFTSETAVKYAFFVVLSVFWKMSIAEKAVYSPAAALCPFCRVRAHRGRKTRSEMSFLGSGNLEQFFLGGFELRKSATIHAGQRILLLLFCCFVKLY